MFKTEGFIETHFHGAFGVNFMDCEVDEVIELAVKMAKLGTTRIYPTLMTGDLKQIKNQIGVIKSAQKKQPKDSAKISGIHLEGPFINAYKKGAHEDKYIIEPNISNYKKIEDDIVKIVTLAPELDNRRDLCKYLHSKGVKVQAGHTMTYDLTECDSVTHLFNATAALTHKFQNIISSALSDDNKYVELIADGNHVIDDVLKTVFKAKPRNRIILISDALPIAHSEFEECEFAGQEVSFVNGSYYNDNGTLAGSGMLQCDVLKRLVNQEILTFDEVVYMMNISPSRYLNVINNAFVTFDDELNPIKTNFIN